MMSTTPGESARRARLVQRTALVTMLCVALASLGCGSDRAARQWDREYLDAVATAQNSSGETAQAAEKYLLELAERAPSEDARRQALLEYALVARAQRAWDEALVRLERVWREPNRDSAGGRAMYEAGRIELEHLGRVVEAQATLFRALREYPDSVGSEFALDILDHRARFDAREAQDPAQRRQRFDAWAGQLDSLARELTGREVARAILMRLANVQDVELDDARAALDVYGRVTKECADCATADDARWQMALLHRKLGQHAQAVHAFEGLASQRETSWFVGTYNSGWAQDARYALATLYLEDLGDRPRAIAQFERFLRDYPDSTRGDDALWHIAALWAKSGDADAQREALEKLVGKYPESRFAGPAGKQLEALR